MKTVALLLLIANGGIWWVNINAIRHMHVTTIVKQQTVVKAKVVEWSI